MGRNIEGAGRLPTDPRLINMLLEKRAAVAAELVEMGQDAETLNALAQFHACKRQSGKYMAVYFAIRDLDVLDAALRQLGQIKDLAKPPYPGGMRV